MSSKFNDCGGITMSVAALNTGGKFLQWQTVSNIVVSN